MNEIVLSMPEKVVRAKLEKISRRKQKLRRFDRNENYKKRVKMHYLKLHIAGVRGDARHGIS